MTLPLPLPRVSLVVPVYNAGRYLAETLDSLLAQRYPDLEIIVIDDGSTDDSWAAIQRYAGRCRVFTQPNQGQAATLNRGWALASGSVLGYLSADDTLEPDAVAQVVQALESRPEAVLAYPDYWLIDADSRRFREVSAPDFDYAEVLVEGVCPPGPGMLFRRQAFARVGGWDPSLRQIPDYEFLLRIGLCGEGVHVARRLASFRVHEQSQTFALADACRVREHGRVIAGFFARDDVPAAYRAARRQAEANAAILMSRGHLRAWRFAQALACWLQALAAHPGVLLRARTWRLLANGLLGRALHHWRARRAEQVRA